MTSTEANSNSWIAFHAYSSEWLGLLRIDECSPSIEQLSSLFRSLKLHPKARRLAIGDANKRDDLVRDFGRQLGEESKVLQMPTLACQTLNTANIRATYHNNMPRLRMSGQDPLGARGLVLLKPYKTNPEIDPLCTSTLLLLPILATCLAQLPNLGPPTRLSDSLLVLLARTLDVVTLLGRRHIVFSSTCSVGLHSGRFSAWGAARWSRWYGTEPEARHTSEERGTADAYWPGFTAAGA